MSDFTIAPRPKPPTFYTTFGERNGGSGAVNALTLGAAALAIVAVSIPMLAFHAVVPMATPSIIVGALCAFDIVVHGLYYKLRYALPNMLAFAALAIGFAWVMS